MKTKRQGPSKGRTVKKQPPVAPAKGRKVKPQPPVAPAKRVKVRQLPRVSTSKRRTLKKQSPVPAAGQDHGEALPPKIKSPDATRDSTPEIIDSKLERMAGTPNPARVAGGGRFHS